MVSVRLFFFAVCALVLTAGCVAIQDYTVDPHTVNQSRVFTSGQARGFSLKLSNDFKYLGCIERSQNDTAHSYQYFVHYFAHEKGDFIAVIPMVTLDVGEWNAYSPWKWESENELHGEKTFYCGTSFQSSLSLNNFEKDLYKKYGYSPGITATVKSWVYTPGGIVGGTRIIIHYIEKENHTKDLTAFSSRANARMNFRIGK